jgi:hypothetical protein
VHVRILGLPVALHVRVQQWQDGLLRELTLMTLDGSDGPQSVPARILRLAEELRARYGGETTPQQQRIDEAAGRGEATIDLVYDVPVEVADAVRQYGALLDELDAHSLRGTFLMPPSPPELVAYRRWYLGQFVDQLEGREPTPWTAASGAADRESLRG